MLVKLPNAPRCVAALLASMESHGQDPGMVAAREALVQGLVLHMDDQDPAFRHLVVEALLNLPPSIHPLVRTKAEEAQPKHVHKVASQPN